METGLGIIEEYKIGEPLFLKNLVLFPLTDGEKEFGRIETLAEAQAKRHLAISELVKPRVDAILIRNNSPNRVFALDGDGLIGAYQDRIINSSALIEERSEVEVPVSCVEAGRFRGSPEFSALPILSYPSLRALICATVSTSLKKTRRFKTNQEEVWQSISKKIERFKVTSQTSSMKDIYSQLTSRLASYKAGIGELKELNGFIVFSGERILGIDLFGSRGLFNKMKERLIESYALEALTQKTSFPPRIGRAKKFWEEIKVAEIKDFPSFALGREIRFETENVIGRGLLIDGSLLHLSAFDRRLRRG